MGVLGFLLFGLFYVFKSAGILWLWFVVAIIVAGVFVVFNFVKIGGQSAFDIFSNAIGFVFTARLYMWQRKEGIAPMELKRIAKPKGKIKEALLKMAPKSRLGMLGSKIDISNVIDREQFWEELTEEAPEENQEEFGRFNRP